MNAYSLLLTPMILLSTTEFEDDNPPYDNVDWMGYAIPFSYMQENRKDMIELEMFLDVFEFGDEDGCGVSIEQQDEENYKNFYDAWQNAQEVK